METIPSGVEFQGFSKSREGVERFSSACPPRVTLGGPTLDAEMVTRTRREAFCQARYGASCGQRLVLVIPWRSTSAPIRIAVRQAE
jgi:hypothetical protein